MSMWSSVVSLLKSILNSHCCLLWEQDRLRVMLLGNSLMLLFTQRLMAHQWSYNPICTKPVCYDNSDFLWRISPELAAQFVITPNNGPKAGGNQLHIQSTDDDLWLGDEDIDLVMIGSTCAHIVSQTRTGVIVTAPSGHNTNTVSVHSIAYGAVSQQNMYTYNPGMTTHKDDFHHYSLLLQSERSVMFNQNADRKQETLSSQSQQQHLSAASMMTLSL